MNLEVELLLSLGKFVPFFLLSYALLGAGLKYIDAAFDEKTLSIRNAIMISPLIGALWIFTMIVDEPSSVLLSSIILGVLLRGKIDNVAHSIGLFIIVFVALVVGLKVNFLLLLFLTACTYMDEVGNDIIDEMGKKDRFRDVFLRYFFGRRWLLKVAVLYLALLNLFPMYSLVALILFDESYLLMDEYSRSKLRRKR